MIRVQMKTIADTAKKKKKKFPRLSCKTKKNKTDNCPESDRERVSDD